MARTKKQTVHNTNVFLKYVKLFTTGSQWENLGEGYMWTALYYYFQLPVGLYLFQNKNVKKYDQPHSYQEKYKLK